MEPFVVESIDEPGVYWSTFEDDGRVAYLYLGTEKGIVADVWLYNRRPAPDRSEFRDKKNLPFLNPREFISREVVDPVVREEDLEFEWLRGPGEGEVTLLLKIRGVLWGKLIPGARPGWSRLAVKDGPLANVLHLNR